MVQNLALMVAGAQTGEGMSRLIGISTTALLFTLGLLHVYWAAGGKWGTDVTIPKQGGTPLFQPPPVGTLLVAILLFSAGLVVLGRLGLWGAGLPRWLFVAETWLNWRRREGVEPSVPQQEGQAGFEVRGPPSRLVSPSVGTCCLASP